MVKHVIILGSTGSIGTQALQVIADNPDHLAVANPQAAETIAAALGGAVRTGATAAADLVKAIPCDTVLNALVGSLGLAATMATIEVGATLALANKESLVAGGTLVTESAAPGQIIPVDSEHSAMAQCLRAGSRTEVDRIVLTASGGPFRGWTRQQMWDVTPEQAAAHPTWSMGQMNTLNSATLVNKGLELIEASLLFDVPAERIDVTVHPQSIVHSMVTFATIAQASPPSMKLPIALALHWPYRVPGAQPALDFSAATTTNWEFMPVDNEAFPAVQLARQVATYGGMLPAVYNAANEQAAAQFLAGRIAFPQIVDTVSEILSHAEAFARTPESIMEVLECEKEARSLADRYLATIMR